MGNKFTSFLKTAWTDVVKAEHAAVAILEKAAADVPAAEADIAKYGPEVAAIAATVVPASGKFTATAINAAVVVGQLIEEGGAAVEKQLLNAGADETFISDIKNLGANLKAAAAKAGLAPSPSSASAPAAASAAPAPVAAAAPLPTLSSDGAGNVVDAATGKPASTTAPGS